MAKGYMIAAGHHLTSEAAEYALKSGGNAVDGALAGWLAACLAEPVLTSPGGGGFAMVAPASGRPRLYDFFTQTPRRPNPAASLFPLEADFGSTRQVFHLGPGSVATPGCVAGLLRLHADFGRLPVAECAAPALELSRSGLVITDHAATLLRVVNDLYQATPESKALFASRIHPDGCLREGERFINRAFESFLGMLIDEGSRWFYHGDIGRIISDFCRDNGGHLIREDFQNYKVEIREPLEIHHNGATIWLNPPPALGGTLIATGLLSRQGRKSLQTREDWIDWIAPLRLMSLMRSHEGQARLAEAEWAGIERACAESESLAEALATLFPSAFGQSHASGTTQISIMDRDGNEVSMTTSNGAGSAIIPQGTGFMLNNMLGEDDLQPEGLNTWKPDQRLASMMAPTLARLSNGQRLAIGSGGSNRIRSTILQLLRRLIDHGCSLEDAVHAPRLHWENNEVHAEAEAASDLAALKRPVPWPVVEHPVPNLFFGGAHSVAGSRDGQLTGIGDPRRGGSVCGG